MRNSILLVQCADQKGLIHRITGALFSQGLNIVHNSEYVDRDSRDFFMRTELDGAVNEPLLLRELRAFLPAGATVALKSPTRKRLVLLATREPHCVGDLLLRNAYGELPGEIQAVVSNHAVLQELVERFEIPYHWVSHEGRSREAHESEMLQVLDSYAPDYLVTAKYMRILTPALVARYAQRIINIHHSFLPAFVGARPYQQAYERGVKIIGATAHFINEDLDEGPIIAQGVVPINHAHSVQNLTLAGREIEKQVLARALKLFLEERVFVHRNKTIVFE